MRLDKGEIGPAIAVILEAKNAEIERLRAEVERLKSIIRSIGGSA